MATIPKRVDDWLVAGRNSESGCESTLSPINP